MRKRTNNFAPHPVRLVRTYRPCFNFSWAERSLIASLIAAAFILSNVAASDAKGLNPCVGGLPSSLDRLISHRYPDWNIAPLQSLDSSAQELYLKDNEKGCPGIAKVNLYGDGRVVYAILLMQLPGKRDTKLLMAQLNKKKQWELITLNEGGGGDIVVAAPSGEYHDVEGGQSLKSKGEVILYSRYEAWAMVFAWTGEKVEQAAILD